MRRHVFPQAPSPTITNFLRMAAIFYQILGHGDTKWKGCKNRALRTALRSLIRAWKKRKSSKMCSILKGTPKSLSHIITPAPKWSCPSNTPRMDPFPYVTTNSSNFQIFWKAVSLPGIFEAYLRFVLDGVNAKKLKGSLLTADVCAKALAGERGWLGRITSKTVVSRKRNNNGQKLLKNAMSQLWLFGNLHNFLPTIE